VVPVRPRRYVRVGGSAAWSACAAGRGGAMSMDRLRQAVEAADHGLHLAPPDGASSGRSTRRRRGVNMDRLRQALDTHHELCDAFDAYLLAETDEDAVGKRSWLAHRFINGGEKAMHALAEAAQSVLDAPRI